MAKSLLLNQRFTPPGMRGQRPDAQGINEVTNPPPPRNRRRRCRLPNLRLSVSQGSVLAVVLDEINYTVASALTARSGAPAPC